MRGPAIQAQLTHHLIVAAVHVCMPGGDETFSVIREAPDLVIGGVSNIRETADRPARHR